MYFIDSGGESSHLPVIHLKAATKSADGNENYSRFVNRTTVPLAVASVRYLIPSEY